MDTLRACSSLALNILGHLHRCLRVSLPLVTDFSSSTDERGLGICSKQVSVVILSVSISSINHSNLLRGTSVWKTSWIAASLEVPGIRNHQIKVRVILNVARDVVVILLEFFESDTTISSSSLSLRKHSVVLFEGLHELNDHFVLGSLP